MRYLLIKNQVVQNVIVADEAFITQIATQYDECVPIEETAPGGPGDGYVNGQVIPQES